MKHVSGFKISPTLMFFWLTAALLAPVVAQNDSAPVTDAARKASVRRQQELVNIRRLLLEGDRKMADEDYSGAYETYKRAFQDTPLHRAAFETRLLAFSKYQEALRLYADEMARQGRIDEATKLVEDFYREARTSQVPGNAINRKTALLLQDLKDGETYEPGQSPKNLERVAKIRELFVLADADAQLGKYDDARMKYAEILSYDPYNSAARRGMRAVDKLMNAYQERGLRSNAGDDAGRGKFHVGEPRSQVGSWKFGGHKLQTAGCSRPEFDTG